MNIFSRLSVRELTKRIEAEVTDTNLRKQLLGVVGLIEKISAMIGFSAFLFVVFCVLGFRHHFDLSLFFFILAIFLFVSYRMICHQFESLGDEHQLGIKTHK